MSFTECVTAGYYQLFVNLVTRLISIFYTAKVSQVVVMFHVVNQRKKNEQ